MILKLMAVFALFFFSTLSKQALALPAKVKLVKCYQAEINFCQFELLSSESGRNIADGGLKFISSDKSMTFEIQEMSVRPMGGKSYVFASGRWNKPSNASPHGKVFALNLADPGEKYSESLERFSSKRAAVPEGQQADAGSDGDISEAISNISTSRNREAPAVKLQRPSKVQTIDFGI